MRLKENRREETYCLMPLRRFFCAISQMFLRSDIESRYWAWLSRCLGILKFTEYWQVTCPQVKLGDTGPAEGQSVTGQTEGNPASNHTGRPPPSVRPPRCSQVMMRGRTLFPPKTKYFSSPITTTWCNHDGRNFEVCLCCSCWAWEEICQNYFICNNKFPKGKLMWTLLTAVT